MNEPYLNDLPFDLRHLRYFLAVAEKRSFTQAAEALGIEQPPLSQQIKDLENKLGVKLFRRERPIKLTDAGHNFLKEVRLIMNQVEQAIKTTRKADQGEKGQLILGFNSSAANSVLSDLLTSFQNHYPKIELILQEQTADELIDGLKKQQIDVGLLHWSRDIYHEEQKLTYQTIREESLILVLAKNHLLAAEKEISIQSLNNETFILPPSDLAYSLYQPVISFFTQVGFPVNEIKIQKATVMLTILSLVAGGVGVSILPANVRNIQREGVVYKPLQEPTPTIQIVAMWRYDNFSPVLKNFLDILPNEA